MKTNLQDFVLDVAKKMAKRDPQSKPKALKLGEIADRIHAHLKRFENDPVINAPVALRKPYYAAGADQRGAYVRVRYVSYGGGGTNLTKAEARRYLIWLDAGNVGTHWAMERDEDTPRMQEGTEK